MHQDTGVEQGSFHCLKNGAKQGFWNKERKRQEQNQKNKILFFLNITLKFNPYMTILKISAIQYTLLEKEL